DNKKKYLEEVCEQFPDILAEVIYAVRKEMAVTLSDVVFRRTGIGTLGNPGTQVLERIVDVMAHELKWNRAKKNTEMEMALKNFETIKE
ncbi:MAG: hypothetical protein JW920_00470, partial [Deltaproteobacteria bacterium]|nr:hypothetical protein [Deltaproteobacteria bacterium]